MSRFYHLPGPPASFKVFLACQALHQVEPSFAYSLARSCATLARKGIAFELGIRAGDPHVDDSRNRLVREFLNTDCTDLLFIDADLSWEPESLIDLCGYDRDVVAGTYRYKQAGEGYPVDLLPGEIWSDADGLIEVNGVPTGFLKIKRHVLEKLATRTFSCKGDLAADTPIIFERGLEGSARIGGDYNFCRKWRALGGKIFLCPDYAMGHTGSKTWTGDVASCLRRENGVALAHGLKAIAERAETPAILNAMVMEWNNPWSVTADFLAACIVLARGAGGHVVECGSGLTTLCLAATGVKVTALEHDAGWSRRIVEAARKHGLMDNIRLCYAPLKDGWYDVADDVSMVPGLLVVDGPPRHLGDRALALERFRPKRYIFDDAQDANVIAAINSLNEWEKAYFGDARKFAVMYRKEPNIEKVAAYG